MKFESIEPALRNAIGRINEVEKNDQLLNGGEDAVYATCYLTLAKQYIRKALEHIQKITPHNEGGDEDGRI